MTKKKTSPIPVILAVLLGLAAIVMLFVPSIGIKDTDTTYTGLQVVFGHSESGIVFFGFSFMNLLPYILALGGVVFAVLAMLGSGSKFAALISAVLFVAAGILFFLSVQCCLPNEGLKTFLSWFGGDVKDYLVLAGGTIAAGVLSIVAGLLSLVKVFIKK